MINNAIFKHFIACLNFFRLRYKHVLLSVVELLTISLSSPPPHTAPLPA